MIFSILKSKKKSVSAVVTVVLLILVVSILMMVVLSWGKDTSKQTLDKITKNYKVLNDIDCSNLNLKISNLKIDEVSKDINFTIENKGNININGIIITILGSTYDGNLTKLEGIFDNVSINGGNIENLSTTNPSFIYTTNKDINYFDTNTITDIIISTPSCPNQTYKVSDYNILNLDSQTIYEDFYFGNLTSTLSTSEEIANADCNDLSPWGLYDNDPYVALEELDYSIFGSQSPSIKIDITNPGSTLSDIQFFDCDINLQEGKRYRLSFSIAGSVDTDESYVKIMKCGSPYTNYGLNEYFTITNTIQTHTFDFYATITDPNARITFYLGNCPEDTYWFDNISLKEINTSLDNYNLLLNNTEIINHNKLDYNTLYFDGNSSIEFSENNSFNFSQSQDFTISTWIRADSNTTGAIISNEKITESGYNLIYDQGDIVFNIGGYASNGLGILADAGNNNSYNDYTNTSRWWNNLVEGQPDFYFIDEYSYTIFYEVIDENNFRLRAQSNGYNIGSASDYYLQFLSGCAEGEIRSIVNADYNSDNSSLYVEIDSPFSCTPSTSDDHRLYHKSPDPMQKFLDGETNNDIEWKQTYFDIDHASFWTMPEENVYEDGGEDEAYFNSSGFFSEDKSTLGGIFRGGFSIQESHNGGWHVGFGNNMTINYQTTDSGWQRDDDFGWDITDPYYSTSEFKMKTFSFNPDLDEIKWWDNNHLLDTKSLNGASINVRYNNKGFGNNYSGNFIQAHNSGHSDEIAQYFVYNRDLSNQEIKNIYSYQAYRYNQDAENISSTKVPLNEFTNLSIKKEDNTCSIYINGDLDKQFTCNPTFDLEGDLTIGYRSSGVNEYFKGVISDISVYNQALDNSHIKKLYYSNKYKYIKSKPTLEYSSCKQILDNGYSYGNGIYTIDPEEGDQKNIFCNMVEDNGGWTLVARIYKDDDQFLYNNENWTGTGSTFGSLIDNGESYRSSLFNTLDKSEIMICDDGALGCNVDNDFSSLEPLTTTFSNAPLQVGGTSKTMDVYSWADRFCKDFWNNSNYMINSEDSDGSPVARLVSTNSYDHMGGIGNSSNSIHNYAAWSSLNYQKLPEFVEIYVR